MNESAVASATRGAMAPLGEASSGVRAETLADAQPARLATLHRVLGWTTMAAFLATGLFLRLGYPGVAPPDLAQRVFFRTHHLYLLGAALVQLLVAAHLRARAAAPAPRPRLRLAASTLLVSAPPLLLLGFLTEHTAEALRGEATSLGWQASLAGVLLHLLAERR
jgi:hypothetical protein